MQEDWLLRKKKDDPSPGLRLRKPGLWSSFVARCVALFLDLPVPTGTRGWTIPPLPGLIINCIQIAFPHEYYWPGVGFLPSVSHFPLIILRSPGLVSCPVGVHLQNGNVCPWPRRARGCLWLEWGGGEDEVAKVMNGREWEELTKRGRASPARHFS